MKSRLTPAAILLLALALRLAPAATMSLSGDDGVQWYVSQRPLGEIPATIRAIGEVHPPLSFYWVHAWMAVGGDGLPWLRLSMILLAVAMVAVVYRVALSAWGEGAARIAGVSVAVSAFHCFYSEEIRMYTMAGLFVALAVWGLYRMRSSWDGAVLYALGALGALYTQYLTGFFLLFLTPVAFGRAYPWRRWLAASAAVAVGFLPQVLTVAGQATAQDLGLREPPPLAWFPELMFQMTFGTTLPRPLAGWGGMLLDPLKWSGLVLPLMLGALLWRRRTEGAVVARWLAAGLFAPMLVLAAMSAWTSVRVFEYRYFDMGVPLLALLLGWAGAELLQGRGRALWQGLALLLLAVNALSLGLMIEDPGVGTADWRGAGAWLAAHLVEKDTIVVQPGMFAAVLSYYVRHVPSGVRLLAENEPPATASELTQNGRLWLVDTPWHPQVRKAGVAAWLPAAGLAADRDVLWESQNFFPANVIRVQLYAR